MLGPYEQKRDFTKTPEPAGEVPSERTGPLRFVVQKHAARRLHYDLRLECDGVLLSWAVPKGPSLNTSERRLAVHTEDHPLSYAHFEGTIPKGEYGGGVVIVWDEGTYSPDEEGLVFEDREEAQRQMREGMAKGKLSFTLRGTKLGGSWALVRTTKGDWLLLKHRDAFASDTRDILLEDRSVRSGLTNDELAAGAQVVPVHHRLRWTDGAVQAPLPTGLLPMIPTEIPAPRDQEGWTYELKLDGIRALAVVDHGEVRMLSRNGNRIEGKFPSICAELATLGHRRLILDGEVVAINEGGRPDFQLLMTRFQLRGARDIAQAETRLPAMFWAFDLLYLDEWDLRACKFKDRREWLEKIEPRGAFLRLNDTFGSDGALLFSHAVQMGFEGVVGKRNDSRYRAGERSTDWVKVKGYATDEFTVVGYARATEGPRQATFKSLILARATPEGLLLVGSVGGGFSDTQLETLRAELDGVPILAASPAKGELELNGPPVWLEPRLVVEVRHQPGEEGRNLRFPVFLRRRPDLDVGEAPPVSPAEPAPTETSSIQVVNLEDVLGQLDTSKDDTVLEVGNERVRVTSLSRVLWPAGEGFGAFTKRDLLRYLVQISPVMIPHLFDRPISFVRFPDGLGGESFFQKHAEKGTPEFVRAVDIYSSHNNRARNYVLCNDLPTLLWLGQVSSLEIHPWYSRVTPDPVNPAATTDFHSSDDALDGSILSYPDFLVVDLDPYIYSGKERAGEEPQLHREAWKRVVEVAMTLKAALEPLGLRSFVKTSGKTGLHIYLPLRRIYNYQQVHAMAKTLGEHVMALAPADVTMEWVVKNRPAKVFFDHNQNVRGKTLVGCYSPRPAYGAPVSMPLEWSQLEKIYPTDFRMDNVPDLVREIGDPWASILGAAQAFG